MSLIGYKRVSSEAQSTDRQDLGELDKVFEEKLSGASASDRPALFVRMQPQRFHQILKAKFGLADR